MTADGPKCGARLHISARRPVLLALAGVALVAMGCESTQDKSAKIAAELGPVRKEEGLKIAAESREVKVASTTLLSDRAGSAVVVRVRSSARRDLAGVPIAIDVLDAKGKSVYTNTIPGIEPALAAIPYVPADGEAVWVNDQILAAGKPAKVDVRIGEGGVPFDGERPRVSVSEPQLEGDPYSGVLAAGEAKNESGEDIDRLLLYAVATEGGRVVAAGRGAIEPFKAKPKPVHYGIYFIGDPRGAEIELAELPEDD